MSDETLRWFGIRFALLSRKLDLLYVRHAISGEAND
jgi:hypothetical protein